ncbi:hypothetical protein EVAR_41188_1 [Eumeta japonica]|uniref:Uncharacterized protein n=1 Tax=Eumeta variegata TaxID=151549 RepID=A0A4C1WPZ3_EUMVA|nr:hypothetical protein EVAR_41188_1 [Eumeta japonica]
MACLALGLAALALVTRTGNITGTINSWRFILRLDSRVCCALLAASYFMSQLFVWQYVVRRCHDEGESYREVVFPKLFPKQENRELDQDQNRKRDGTEIGNGTIAILISQGCDMQDEGIRFMSTRPEPRAKN